jgi:hypothetical protein
MANCTDITNDTFVSYADSQNMVYDRSGAKGNKIEFRPMNAQGTDCQAVATQRIDYVNGGNLINKDGSNQGGGFMVPVLSRELRLVMVPTLTPKLAPIMAIARVF